MRRRDWLLLLLALDDASSALDPVRLQKGMFLLAKEGGISPGERYSFRAYDYGPLSPTIYRDLDDLVATGLVDEVDAPGYTWKRYQASEQGIDLAQELVDGLDPERRVALEWLAELKRDVLSLGFSGLLRHVYERYPDFARNSVFR